MTQASRQKGRAPPLTLSRLLEEDAGGSASGINHNARRALMSDVELLRGRGTARGPAKEEWCEAGGATFRAVTVLTVLTVLTASSLAGRTAGRSVGRRR